MNLQISKVLSRGKGFYDTTAGAAIGGSIGILSDALQNLSTSSSTVSALQLVGAFCEGGIGLSLLSLGRLSYDFKHASRIPGDPLKEYKEPCRKTIFIILALFLMMCISLTLAGHFRSYSFQEKPENAQILPKFSDTTTSGKPNVGQE